MELNNNNIEIKESETLVNFGGEVKALGEGKIAGYLVRFTDDNSPDLTGDYFQKDTDFGDASTTPILFHHGLDATLGIKSLGKGTLKLDEVGVWVEAILSMRDKYEKAIYDLIKKGKLGWSSGTASHLVKRISTGKSFKITSWPLGLDASLTPTPAEPRNEAVSLKSISTKSVQELESECDSLGDGTDQTNTLTGNIGNTTMENTTKTPEQIAEEEKQAAERLAAESKKSVPSGQVDIGAILAQVNEEQQKQANEIKARQDAEKNIKEQVSAMVGNIMKSAPAVNGGGYKTNLNTKTQRGDDAKKAFNHFLKTGDAGGIRTGDAYEDAIKTDYNFEEGTQYYGQEVVPTEIVAEIAKIREPLSFARAAGCRVMPVGTSTVWLPKEGAVALEAPTVAEKGEHIEDTSKPLDKAIVTILKKGLSEFATTEILEDSVVDISQFLNYRWGKSLAKAENASALTAMAASSTLGVTAASHTTLTAAEIVRQYYKVPAEYRDNVSWLMTNNTEGVIRGLTGNWFQLVPNTLGGSPAVGQPTGYLIDPRSKVFNYSGVDELDAGAAKTVWTFNAPASITLCERKGMTILRDPYTDARTGKVWFILSARFGFGITDALGIYYILHPTA